MFTAGLIVFREVFEISIVVCVILAATRQVPNRSWWVSAGILTGTAVVGIIALFGHSIIGFASQIDKHVFNAIALFVAASLIAVSVIWMQSHGKQISMQMKAVSKSVQDGEKPLYMLAAVVALAVIREGSEIVLFLYGVYTSGESTITDIIAGSILGTGLGALTGVLMYLGFIRIPVKQLFSISSWLLTFLAAGMVAKGVGHLVSADILPALINPLWDTSAILSQKEWLGRFLSVLVGYQDHPSAMQVISYVATLGVVSLTMLLGKGMTRHPANCVPVSENQ